MAAEATTSGPNWSQIHALARAIVAAGNAASLPYVAAQSDLGSAAPMADEHGRPFAASLPWVATDREYWRNRRLALQSTFLHAARVFAEPIWFADGRLGSWRPTRLLDMIDCAGVEAQFGFAAAIIAPVHLAGGQVGAVVWVTRTPIDAAGIFAEHAEAMFCLARRFIAAHAEITAPRAHGPLGRLSAREAQCVRWAAAGKTNAEIGTILSLSVSTVRFHLRNAAEKLGVATRARMIRVATGHGFLGRHA